MSANPELTASQVGLPNSVLDPVSLYTIELSLLWTYRRLFWAARWFRIAWWANIVYLTCWVLATAFAGLFQCYPVDFFWNRTYLYIPGSQPPPGASLQGRCIDPVYVVYVTVLSSVSDVSVWLLAIAAVCQLQMSAKRKFWVCVLLCLGFMYVTDPNVVS